MDPKALKEISTRVYHQFPEMTGVQPKVRRQEASLDGNPAHNFLVTFQKRVELPGGKSLPRYVRVLVNSAGKILKISTSHG